MILPESLRTLQWRPVAGLMLAGLLGWLAAWFMLPGGPVSGGPAPGTTAAQTRPGVQAERGSPTGSKDPAMGQALEKLSRSQAIVSEGAARSVPFAPTARSAASAALPGVAPKLSASDAARAQKRQAMLDLQTAALAEIQAVPPGDTKKLIAALERFDARMRATGAPSIIDLDKMRKTMEGVDRMQDLNRQLAAESEKGRNADPIKIQALGKDIVATQKQMPRQFIRADVMQQRMAR